MKSYSLAVAAATAALVVSSPAAAGLKEDLAAKEAQLVALRAEVEPLARPIMVNGSDLRVFISLAPLVNAVSALNSRPQAARTINVQSTGRNGDFWSNGGDWCGSYVELDSGNSLHATAAMSNFSAQVRDDGAIALASRADINGHVQVKFQFKGRRVSQTIGICPACVHTNVCPPGGGVGTSIGVGFSKTIDMQLLMAFARSADGRSVDYRASFVSPKEVSVTAEIGLGPIGTLGQPMSFNLPAGPIASGSIPLLVTNDGKFELPGGAGARVYSLVLTPAEFVAGKNGITAAWKASVRFAPGGTNAASR